MKGISLITALLLGPMTAMANQLSLKNGDRILSDRYLSDPLAGSKQNDLILSTGLRVKLGIMK